MYLFYTFVKFCKNMLLNTDHSTVAQSPDTRTQNSDAIFSLFIFLLKQKNFK